MTSTAPPRLPADLPSVTRPPASPAGGHLAAVDVIRFLTIGGVIVVHCTSFANSTGSLAANGVLQLFHVTRSVFLMLSAFVLTYSFLRRPLPPASFWRRRYPLVLVPYAVWTAIYLVTGGDYHPSVALAGTFLRDLADGRAKFHLYFLLLTMQLYLVFPALMALLRRRPRLVVPLVWAGLAFQLLFTAAVHYGWRPAVIGGWFARPDDWLPSYAMYVFGGIAAAWHFDAVTRWVRGHHRLVVWAFAGSVVVAVASYVADLSVLGYTPIKASEVFQPANTIEAVTATAAQYAAGLWLADRLSARRLAWLERSSDVSFGVFLAHPLVMGVLLDATGWIHLSGWPSGAVEAVLVVAMVPFIYAVTFVGVDRVRRTRASMWLTGRRGPRPVPTPAPAPA